MSSPAAPFTNGVGILQLSPESAEEYIEYLKSSDRLDEAAQRLATVVNDERFVSKAGKSNYQVGLLEDGGGVRVVLPPGPRLRCSPDTLCPAAVARAMRPYLPESRQGTVPQCRCHHPWWAYPLHRPAGQAVVLPG